MKSSDASWIIYNFADEIFLNSFFLQNHERPQVNETLTVWGQLNLRNVINVGHSMMLIIILININLTAILKNTNINYQNVHYQGGRLQDDDLPRGQPEVTNEISWSPSLNSPPPQDLLERQPTDVE